MELVSDYAEGVEVDLFYGGKVTLGLPMAKGGFSVVYAGVFGDIPAAVKVLRKKDAAFQREVNVMLTLNHPNICQFLGYIHDAGKEMLVTARYTCDMLDFLDSNKPTEVELKHFLREFFKGVEYLHSVGVAHLDLKLENLLLTDQGSVVICDFGFATRCETSTRLLGTMGYVSPEVLYSEKMGPYHTFKADLWSASIVAFALGMGFLPFDHHYVRCQNYRRYRRQRSEFWNHFGDSDYVQFLAWLTQNVPHKRRVQATAHPFLL